MLCQVPPYAARHGVVPLAAQAAPPGCAVAGSRWRKAMLLRQAVRSSCAISFSYFTLMVQDARRAASGGRCAGRQVQAERDSE